MRNLVDELRAENGFADGISNRENNLASHPRCALREANDARAVNMLRNATEHKVKLARRLWLFEASMRCREVIKNREFRVKFRS